MNLREVVQNTQAFLPDINTKIHTVFMGGHKKTGEKSLRLKFWYI